MLAALKGTTILSPENEVRIMTFPALTMALFEGRFRTE